MISLRYRIIILSRSLEAWPHFSNRQSKSMAVSLQHKIIFGYVILMAVIGSMAAILVHERERVHEIEAESAEIRQVRRDINAVHRHITRLAILGESVIGWEGADSTRYRTLRLRTDSLITLQQWQTVEH